MKHVIFLHLVLELTEAGAVTRPVLEDPSSEVRLPDVEPETDHLGAITLPGTSIAGSLRAHVARRAPGAEVALFGEVTADSATPSAVRVLGSRLTTAAAGTVDLRQTAIDRTRGAARTSHLRHSRLVAAGTRFQVFLRLDDVAGAQEAVLLDGLATWQPLIGRAVTSGHGAARVVSLHRGRCDLTTKEGLGTFLSAHGPELVVAVATEPVPLADPTPREHLRIAFSLTSALHVGSGASRSGPADGPGHEVTPVFRLAGLPAVPGTSLRGVLRSRSEYALRSLGLPACLDGGCGTCLPCGIFGHGGGHDDSSTTVGRRGRIRVLDAVIADPVVVTRSHVAIDRFTGGALDGALWTVEVVESGRFELVVERLDATDHEWELAQALVRLVAQDLHDDVLGIGGRTTAGHGSVRMDDPDPGSLAVAQRTVRSLLAACPVGTSS